MCNRKLIVIADSHLGIKQDDTTLISNFIETLNPAETELLFLGDLFHIWAGPSKFHTKLVKQFLLFLQDFRNQNGLCYLVTGNRDVFIKEKTAHHNSASLPFDLIAVDALILNKPGGRLVAVHGDTVNSTDNKYLRWRKTIRHPLFQFPFNLIPSRQAKKIMFSLEKKLKHTNVAFRQEFPKDEWVRFLAKMQQTSSPDLLISGHFHPESTIKNKSGATTGLVIPDWCENQFYLEVNEDLSYQEKHYLKG